MGTPPLTLGRVIKVLITTTTLAAAAIGAPWSHPAAAQPVANQVIATDPSDGDQGVDAIGGVVFNAAGESEGDLISITFAQPVPSTDHVVISSSPAIEGCTGYYDILSSFPTPTVTIATILLLKPDTLYTFSVFYDGVDIYDFSFDVAHYATQGDPGSITCADRQARHQFPYN